MYNSSKMEYYRHRHEQQKDAYDDDFKGFTKEAESSQGIISKKDKGKSSLIKKLFRKGQ